MGNLRNTVWYDIGFTDGVYNINIGEHITYSGLKPAYAIGLLEGKKQRKKYKMVKLLKREDSNDE